MFRTQARQIGDDFNLIRKFDALPGRVFAVCYNADGSRIAAAGSLDGHGEARVYQARRREAGLEVRAGGLRVVCDRLSARRQGAGRRRLRRDGATD